MANRLHVIKLGSAIVDNPNRLAICLQQFSKLASPKILLHGGGKLATSLSERLGLTPTFIEGRRITDSDTLDVAIMVYAGLINKKIVSALNQLGGQAIGLCGADLKLVTSKKRDIIPIDYGFVGDVEEINVAMFSQLFALDWQPVISAITWSPKDGLLNTNADSLGSVLANKLSKDYDVSLQLVSENSGVLSDLSDPDSLIRTITAEDYAFLKSSGAISGGMIPKLDGAFAALKVGIKEIWITGEVVSSGDVVGTKISLS